MSVYFLRETFAVCTVFNGVNLIWQFYKNVYCILKGLRKGVNMRWGVFIPNGSAMKAVAKLVDEGKVMKHCLLWSLIANQFFACLYCFCELVAYISSSVLSRSLMASSPKVLLE